MSSYKEKKRRIQEEEEKANEVTSVIVQFQAADGEKKGPQVDIPSNSSPTQLEELLNQLVEAEEPVPFAFYINDSEIATSVKETLNELGETTEGVTVIQYRPLSIYRVNPVTRCSDSIPGHTEAILHVSFSPDGTVLGTGGGDMTVRFWDISTCTPIKTCVGHKNHVLCTAWSPNGRMYASGDKNGDIIVWNGKTGEQISKLTGHRQWVTSLSWEPLHLNGKCDRLASSSRDGTVIVWNVASRRKEITIAGHTDSIECCKWSGEGFLYTASRDRTIRVWALENSSAKLVRVLIGHAHRINALSLNTDYVLRTGGFDWEKKDFASDEEMKACARKKYEEFKKSGGERLCSCSDDFTMFLWEPATAKQPIARLTGHQQLVNHIAFSPDGRYIASASFDKKVKVWDGSTGKLLNTLSGHVGAVYQITWSPDSRFVASASKDSTVKIWKPLGKKALYTLSGHMDEVYGIDWSPYANHVASGGKDRLVKM